MSYQNIAVKGIKVGLSTRLMILATKPIRDYLGEGGVSGSVDYVDGRVNVILTRGGSNKGWHDKATGMFRYQISSFQHLSSVPHFTSTIPDRVITYEEGKVVFIMPQQMASPQPRNRNKHKNKPNETRKSWTPTSVVGHALHADITLAEAVSTVNKYKAEMGESLVLEIKPDEGILRALVEYR